MTTRPTTRPPIQCPIFKIRLILALNLPFRSVGGWSGHSNQSVNQYTKKIMLCTCPIDVCHILQRCACSLDFDGIRKVFLEQISSSCNAGSPTIFAWIRSTSPWPSLGPAMSVGNSVQCRIWSTPSEWNNHGIYNRVHEVVLKWGGKPAAPATALKILRTCSSYTAPSPLQIVTEELTCQNGFPAICSKLKCLSPKYCFCFDIGCFDIGRKICCIRYIYIYIHDTMYNIYLFWGYHEYDSYDRFRKSFRVWFSGSWEGCHTAFSLLGCLFHGILSISLARHCLAMTDGRQTLVLVTVP